MPWLIHMGPRGVAGHRFVSADGRRTVLRAVLSVGAERRIFPLGTHGAQHRAALSAHWENRAEKFQTLEIDLTEGLPYGLPFQISVQNRRIL
jgi:hypothetical protein